MHVTATAISLNVPDPRASADFLSRHVGYTTEMEADGFVSMAHPNGGPNVIYLRTGLASFKPAIGPVAPVTGCCWPSWSTTSTLRTRQPAPLAPP